MDGMLSQEEINALLNGVSNEADSTPAEETTEPESSSAVSNDMDASEVLSDIERDAIGEMRNIIYDLRPMSFDDLGFKQCIENYIGNLKQNFSNFLIIIMNAICNTS